MAETSEPTTACSSPIPEDTTVTAEEAIALINDGSFFTKVCVFCLKRADELITLDSYIAPINEENVYLVGDVVNQLIEIEDIIGNVGLETICSICLERAMESISFKEQSKSSLQQLQTILKNIGNYNKECNSKNTIKTEAHITLQPEFEYKDDLPVYTCQCSALFLNKGPFEEHLKRHFPLEDSNQILNKFEQEHMIYLKDLVTQWSDQIDDICSVCFQRDKTLSLLDLTIQLKGHVVDGKNVKLKDFLLDIGHNLEKSQQSSDKICNKCLEILIPSLVVLESSKLKHDILKKSCNFSNDEINESDNHQKVIDSVSDHSITSPNTNTKDCQKTNVIITKSETSDSQIKFDYLISVQCNGRTKNEHVSVKSGNTNTESGSCEESLSMNSSDNSKNNSLKSDGVISTHDNEGTPDSDSAENNANNADNICEETENNDSDENSDNNSVTSEGTAHTDQLKVNDHHNKSNNVNNNVKYDSVVTAQSSKAMVDKDSDLNSSNEIAKSDGLISPNFFRKITQIPSAVKTDSLELDNEKIIPTKPVSNDKQELITAGPHGCSKCSMKFKSFNELRYHLEKSHGRSYPCNICGKLLLRKCSLKLHMKNHFEAKSDRVAPAFKCEYCPKSFSTQNTLLGHVNKEHLKVTPYKCDICWKEFYSASTLSEHKKRIHSANYVKKCSKCDYCQEKFRDVMAKTKHMKDKHGYQSQYPYLCELCSNQFEFKHYLRRHMLRAHTTKQCYKCYKTVDWTVHKAHVATCSGKTDMSQINFKFECDHCSEKFVTKFKLLSHIYSSHFKEKPYKCNVCKKTFLRLCILKQHQKSHSAIAVVSKGKVYTCPFCSEKLYSWASKISHMKKVHGVVFEKKFMCDLCSKQFEHKSALGSHKKEYHTEKTCPICGKTMKLKCFLEHMRTHNQQGGSFACDQCPKRYWRKRRLEDHVNSCHLNLKPYKCDMCEKAFASRSYLRSHKKTHNTPHTEYRELKCPKCTEKFPYSNARRIHMKREHGHVEEKKYTCDHCGTRRATKTEISRHITNTHFKKQCPICGKNLQVSAYRDHIKNHNGTLAKNYGCEFCPNKYRNESHLIAHINSEHFKVRPYLCDVCNRGYTSLHILKDHQKIHLGTKKCKCEFCDVVLTNSGGLKKHMRLHTGEKPYLCSFCDEKFITTSARANHIRKKHESASYVCKLCSSVLSSPESLSGHMFKVHKIRVSADKYMPSTHTVFIRWPLQNDSNKTDAVEEEVLIGMDPEFEELIS